MVDATRGIKPSDLIANADAVFFDAGFTLVEPVLPIEQVYYQVAQKFADGIAEEDFLNHMRSLWHDPDRRRKLLGEGLECSDKIENENWRRFTRQVAVPFADLTARHEDWLTALIGHFEEAAAWRCIEHAIHVLDELRRQGKKLAVLTNWHSTFHRLAAAHGITERVDFIFTSAEVGFRKPHGEIFRRALVGTGVDARNAVHIGDSLKEDIHGAAKAGIPALHFVGAVPNPGGEPAVVRINSLRELLG